MKIEVAKSAGFCFGVDRAVAMCERLLSEGRSIATLGPIIHNRQVVEQLAAKGCHAVENPADTPRGAALVIRSHGVPRSVYEECERLGVEVVDATCPFVAKIHNIVASAGAEGKTVLIAGDSEHPEVKGIVGHCVGKVVVFEDLERLENIIATELCDEECIMVAQTTFNLEKYDEYAAHAKKIYTKLTVFDTICNATRARQLEAEALAKRCSVCVVIGGRNSSNTKKLYDVCSRYASTYSVESKDELTGEMLRGAKSVGVTAGASTPSPLIEEVLVKMTDIKEEEFNFEQALEDSLKLVHRGMRVDGVVTEVRPNEIVVDIGTKHTGIVPADEVSEDASLTPADVVKVGETIHLIVTKVQDLEGIVTLSKKRVDSEKGFEEISAAVEDGTIFDAYISEVVNKGLVAIVKGIRVFIPASQATLRRGEPYEQLAHTNQQIKILEVNPGRRRAIGSIRAVLETENQKARDEFWQTVEVGKEYTGAVKSITSYGAFVDLGGVDGMIHISEMSWGRIKSPSEVMKVGDVVDVYVKDVDFDTKKVSLGYRKEADNPWHAIQDYPIGSEFTAPVVSVTKFGAFVRILPGIDGLVHISELSSDRVENPGDVVKVGDEVNVRLIGVDLDKKRVSLSMRPEGEPRTGNRARRDLEHTAAEASVAVEGAVKGAKDLLEKAGDALEGLGGKISDVVDTAAEKLAAGAAGLGEAAQDYADSARYEAKDVIDEAKPVINKAIKTEEKIVSETTEKVNSKADDFKEKASDVLDKAVDTVKDLADKGADFVDDLKEKSGPAIDKAKEYADKAGDVIENVADKATDAVEDLLDKIKDKLDGDDDKPAAPAATDEAPKA